MQPTTGHTREKGFGLVELLIALTLGLFLVAGIVSIFASNKATYTSQQGISRVQENARFAVHGLVKNIRQAGYLGCRRQGQFFLNTLNNPNTFFNNFSQAIRGYTAGNLPAALAPISPASNTDVLSLRVPVDSGNTLAVSMPSRGASPLQLKNPAKDLSKGDLAMISSCAGGATIFRAAGVSGNAVHTPTGLNLRSAYKQNQTTLQRVATVTYYIDTNKNTNVRGLYRKVGNQPGEELVRGVDNLQVRYGLNNKFVGAGAVGNNWNQVASVHVALLVNSVKTVGTDTSRTKFKMFRYTPNQITVTVPRDHRLRRVIEASSQLRNRQRKP